MRFPLVGLALLAGFRAAVGQAYGPGSGPTHRVQLFVEDFTQPDSIPVLGKLGAFTADLLRLDLLQVSIADVKRTSRAPACGGVLSSADSVNRPRAGGDFYVVRGSITARGTDAYLDFAFDRCRADTLTTLLHKTQPLSLSEPLEDLTLIGGYVTSTLRAQLPRIGVAVLALKPVRPEDAEERRLAASVRQRLVEAIWRSPDLRPADSGRSAYSISGSIAFDTRRPAPAAEPSRDVEVRLRVGVARQPNGYPLAAVRGSRGNLEALYSDVADQALRGLGEVVYAESHSLTQRLDAMEAAALLERARQLMCDGAPQACTPDSAGAVAVLTAAAQKSPDNWHVLLLLGRVQVGSRNPSTAITALTRAQELVDRDRRVGRAVPADEQSQLLNALGDLYRSTGSYETAAADYGESLRLRPSQMDIYVKQARSLRFAGARAQALRVLADGLRLEPGSLPLNQEAVDVIRDFGAKDLDSVAATLRALGTTVRKAPSDIRREYTDSLLALGQELFDARAGTRLQVVFETVLQIGPANAAARARANGYLGAIFLGDLDAQPLTNGCLAALVPGFQAGLVDQYLASAPVESEDLPTVTREWLLRLRALYWERQADYAKAMPFAERAVRVQPTKNGSLVLGEIAFLWAKQQDSAAHTCEDATRRAPGTRQLYLRAVEQFRPLVEQRYDAADWYLREANHALGRDEETKELMASLLKQTPRDFSALHILQYVCNEYLGDIQCSWGLVRTRDSLHLIAPDYTGSILDAGEIAVLAGELQRAEAWFGRLSRVQLVPRRQIITTFYRVWIAIERRQADALPGAYGEWQASAERFRQSQSTLSWSFEGAKHVLATTGNSRIGRPCVDLLQLMIDSLEQSARPIPVLTPSCQRASD